MRKRYLPLAAVLGAATAVAPGIASSETGPTMEAASAGLYGFAWSPSQVAVGAGGAVTLRNTSTTVHHGVHWVGGPATPECSGVPVGSTAAASGTSWSGTCKFTQPGTYTFYCTVHGPEMTGTVTVSAAETTTTTTGTTTAPTTPTTPTTTTPPKPTGPPAQGLSLRAAGHGGLVRGSLRVTAAGAGGQLEVGVFAKRATLARRSASVRVGRLVREGLAAGPLRFTVKLDAAARAALRRHRRLVLSVRIVLTPPYGEPTTLTRALVAHR